MDIIVEKNAEDKANVHQKICNHLNATFIKKNHDYGDSFSILYGKLGMIYALGHLHEKLLRIETLATGDRAKVEESIDDSLLDLANYAVMTLMERGWRP